MWPKRRGDLLRRVMQFIHSFLRVDRHSTTNPVCSGIAKAQVIDDHADNDAGRLTSLDDDARSTIIIHPFLLFVQQRKRLTGHRFVVYLYRSPDEVPLARDAGAHSDAR